MKSRLKIASAIAVSALCTVRLHAQVPANVAAQLRALGTGVCVTGKIAVYVAWGELDPPNIISFDEGLKNALCKAGRCPTTGYFKDHSHMSLVFSPNTTDTSVTAPILKWMKSIK